MHVTDDSVLETSTTTGTSPFVCTGAVAGHSTFAAARRPDGSAIQVGDTVYYAGWLVDGSGNRGAEYEDGIGTYSAVATITRTTPLKSSNSNALVAFSAGTKYITITVIASKLVQLDPGDAIDLPVAVTVAVPAASRAKLFFKKIAGRMMLAFTGPSGLDTSVQPHLGRNKVTRWIPAGNSTTIVADGAAALTATGTATTANVATTNRHTYQKRLDYLVTTAATTAVAGFRAAAAQWGIGGVAAGDGGFHFIFRYGPATGVATTTHRSFVGMANSTAAPTDVEPSSITNIFGAGYDAADTNIQIMYRAAGAVNKIDLGASFPVPTADRTKSYELALFSPPGTTQRVDYEFTDLGTGAVATGSITTNLPTTGTLLAPRGWMSVGGTSSVIGIALMIGYIESDY